MIGYRNRPTKLRIATYLAPNMLPLYRSIASYIGERLELETELVTGVSFDQFEKGEVDAGFLCGLPYVRLADQDPSPVRLLAAPVLQGERYEGKAIYYSDVIVSRESAYQSFADLRGCTWSYNDQDSQSGYGITLYWLARHGETNGFFGKVIQAGFHQRSISLVASGEVDASAIDSQVLAVGMRLQPQLKRKLRAIDALGPSPIQPVVAAAHLAVPLLEDLQLVLLEMGDDPRAREFLSYGFIERYTAVEDSHYDSIRDMIAVVQEVGLEEIK